MPGVTSDSGDTSTAIVPLASDLQNQPVRYPLRHGLKSPITRVSLCWARGNTLRVTVLREQQQPPLSDGSQGESDVDAGGRVVELKLSSGGDDEISDSEWRRIAYGSVTPFAVLQSRKNADSALAKMAVDSSPYNADCCEEYASFYSLRQNVYLKVEIGALRFFTNFFKSKYQEFETIRGEHVVEYSKEINFLLGGPKSSPNLVIEDPKTVLKKTEEPTSLKAAWEMLDIFYADKQSQTWIPEQLVDWLADYDCLFSATHPTVHSKLVDFQEELVALQAVEDDPRYWEAMSSALAVGWLDTVVKLLRLHGSYQLDQLGIRETENGLVEAVAVLISKMPRMRSELSAEKLGECYKTKPDFMKAWERWRAQVTKLDCSGFWLQCDHQQTEKGLKTMLQIMLGNASSLSNATFHWIELFISHFLYIRPFTTGLESMHNLAEKCMQSKQVSSYHKLMGLLTGILADNTEVVLAECSKSFGPWMIAHGMELLTAGSPQAEIILQTEHSKVGGVSIEELHRLVYAQVLSSHALTWQIAPVYLTSCIKQGMGLLENLLYRQPVQHKKVFLKSLEICRLYEFDTISSDIMKITGVHDWKHGKKGSGVFWLQQARDEVRLNRIAKQLFDFVGKSFSDDSLKQWEGLIELLGSETRTAGGLEFLNKYRDFRRHLQVVHAGVATDTAKKAAEVLISLMKNPSTPQQFWLPLLHDSLKLLNWKDRPLLNVSQTNLLINKLQELSMARLRPDFIDAALPPDALSSVRLALGTNLGRAILEE